VGITERPKNRLKNLEIKELVAVQKLLNGNVLPDK
jgi:hypothetical protein